MSWTHTRSRIALAIQHDPDADVTELRRQLKAERLEAHVQQIVDSAPPLSPEQREKIAALLRGGGSAAAA
jgi:hypothetical protein